MEPSSSGRTSSSHLSGAEKPGASAGIARDAQHPPAIADGRPGPGRQEPAESTAGYAELRRRVRAAGLLDRSYRYYATLALALLAGLVMVGIALASWPGWGDVLAVPALVLIMMQLGFLGHDAGHNGILHRSRLNRVAGVVVYPLLLGLSFESWVASHNAHHAHTNEVDADPDINNPLLAFTPEQAASRRGLLRWIARHQAYLYFPFSTLTTLSYRLDAWRHGLAGHERRSTRLELALVAVNLVGCFVVPAVLLGPGRWLVVFGLTHLVLGVYMASVFAPNHKGMPLIRDRQLSFFQQQVVTSRNVRGGPVVDFLYGGLNYQIEHHLFPNLARNRLPACRELVREFCLQAGLPYTEQGVFASYRSLLRELHLVGRSEGQPALSA